MAAVKKNALVLDVAAIEEEFFEYAIVYGLRFSEEPYYCAWFLNHHVGTNFKRNKYFFMEHENLFDLYECFDKKLSIEHLLYTNHRNGNYMIRELRGFQYFWMLKGEDAAYIYINTVQQKLKELNLPIELQMIELEKITNNNVFIF